MLVTTVVLVAQVLIQAPSSRAVGDSTTHLKVPAALTAAEAHRLLSEARWPEGSATRPPQWTGPAWLAVERALDRHADARQRQLVPLIVALNAEFPIVAWQRSSMLPARAHTLQERALDAAVALERELFEDLRQAFDGAVPREALPAWRAAIDRAERRRRRSALMRPARLVHATVSDVERIVRDATPEALDDPIVRETLDQWAAQLDGRIEALTRAERQARERFRAALDRIQIDPGGDLEQLRLRGGDAYPLWLDASAPLRAAIAAEVADGRAAIDAIASRLDAHHGGRRGRVLVDRWHRLTHWFPVRRVTGPPPEGSAAVLAAWSESELASRLASISIIERHSPVRWPLAGVSPLPSGLLETLVPPLKALSDQQRQRADAVNALAEAHGAEVAARIGELRIDRLPDRWSDPARFDARRIRPVRLLGSLEYFGTPAPESLCLQPPTRGGLELLGRAIHGDPAQRALFTAMSDVLLASAAATDLELGDRRDLPVSFLRRVRGEPAELIGLLDREELRTQRQMALEADFFAQATMFAKPDDAPLVQLIAIARRVDHHLQPTRFVLEQDAALGDDRRASTNPLTIVAYTAIERRAARSINHRVGDTDGPTRPERATDLNLLDRAVELALEAAPEIERLAAARGAEARAFRRDHLPKYATTEATIVPEAHLDRAGARWWRSDDARRREAARLHDRLIETVTATLAPNDDIRRRWLADAWPTIHGLEPKVRSRIEQAVATANGRPDRGDADRLHALNELLRWLDEGWSRLAEAAMAAMIDMPPAAASVHVFGDAQADRLKRSRSRFEWSRRELAERAAIRLAVIVGE